MSGLETHQVPVPAAVVSPLRRPAATAAPAVARVLALQRAAGNRAVGRLLRRAAPAPLLPGTALRLAAEGTRGTNRALPHLERIQRSFGRHDVSSVQAFTDARADRAARALGASAYAAGDRVAFSGSPSLRTAAHEAAHVVQQRAGVPLPGGVGRRGDRYERHAQRVADAVAQGRSAEPLLDEVAPSGSPGPSTSTTTPSALQADIGLEIELPVPIVTAEGEDISGEATLGRVPGIKIVTDHNPDLTGRWRGKSISCVEAVVEHVNEAVVGGERLLKERLNTVRILIDGLNEALKARAATPWAEFWGSGGDYRLVSDVVGGKLFQDIGYVQFTVGVAPSVVTRFLESMEVLGAPTKGATPPKTAKVRRESREYATEMMRGAVALSPKARRDLQGYLVLCYMLVGGLYNGMRDRTLENAGVLDPTKGVMKNYARLLPRMSPGQMFDTVDPQAQAHIKDKGEALVDGLKACMLHHRKEKEKELKDAIKQKVKPKFRDPAEVMTGNPALAKLIASVGDPTIKVDISAERLYGKMAVAQGPDLVSPHLKGVAVEVRHHAALSGGEKNRMTREEWEETALTWYRRTLMYLHEQEEARRSSEATG